MKSSVVLRRGVCGLLGVPEGGPQQNKHWFHFHLTPKRLQREMCVNIVPSLPNYNIEGYAILDEDSLKLGLV